MQGAVHDASALYTVPQVTNSWNYNEHCTFTLQSEIFTCTVSLWVLLHVYLACKVQSTMQVTCILCTRCTALCNYSAHCTSKWCTCSVFRAPVAPMRSLIVPTVGVHLSSLTLCKVNAQCSDECIYSVHCMCTVHRWVHCQCRGCPKTATIGESHKF